MNYLRLLSRVEGKSLNACCFSRSLAIMKNVSGAQTYARGRATSKPKRSVMISSVSGKHDSTPKLCNEYGRSNKPISKRTCQPLILEHENDGVVESAPIIKSRKIKWREPIEKWWNDDHNGSDAFEKRLVKTSLNSNGIDAFQKRKVKTSRSSKKLRAIVPKRIVQRRAETIVKEVDVC